MPASSVASNKNAQAAPLWKNQDTKEVLKVAYILGSENKMIHKMTLAYFEKAMHGPSEEVIYI